MVLPERRLMLNAVWIATIHRIGRACAPHAAPADFSPKTGYRYQADDMRSQALMKRKIITGCKY
jgi:hypothetical protein